ncbi:MAG: hypothetical protein ABW022_16685 [Actinoplanes sp.]
MFRFGLVICGLLGLLDIASVLGTGEDAAPVFVIVVSLVLGLITVGALIPAWRGNRRGLLTVVVSRVVSALLGIGAFFDDAAPDWVRVMVVVAMVVTALAVVLVMPRLSRVASEV